MTAACAGIVDKLRQALPIDLPGAVPVYVVPNTEGIGTFYGCGIHAYTSPCLDLRMQPILEASGDWKGRGFAVVVDPPALEWSEPALMGLMIHETGHYLDHWWVAAQPAEMFSTPLAGVGFDPKPQPSRRHFAFDQHEDRWIRATLHAWHRANQNGFNIPIDELCLAGDNYGLSHAACYAVHLEDEFKAQAHNPIPGMLQKVDPPEGFVRRWRLDMDVYGL